MNKLSKFIKGIREHDNLTQSELAEKLGLNYVTISKIENGHRIGSKALRALSKYTGVRVSELKKMESVVE